jgi:hypothetical protein
MGLELGGDRHARTGMMDEWPVLSTKGLLVAPFATKWGGTTRGGGAHPPPECPKGDCSAP